MGITFNPFIGNLDFTGGSGGGGTGTVTHTGALTLNELILGNGGADIKAVAASDGQVPIGKSSDGTVTLATLTQGTGITITNGAASITIAASSAVLAFEDFAFFCGQ